MSTTFGVPINDDTLKLMSRYTGKKITQEDRAREAMRLIHAEDKHLSALNHALDLKNSHGIFGIGVTAMVLIYNATGDTLVLQVVEQQKDWSGEVARELSFFHPTVSFQNGQWIAFVHMDSTESEAARVFRGRDITGQVRDYMVAWSVSWSRRTNSAYTEVREKEHFPKLWDHYKGLLEKAGKVTRDQTDEYCASTISVGGYTSSEVIAVLQHKFSPLLEGGTIIPPPLPSPWPRVGNIASRWRELHGAGSWEGLLDPLDADLRASIIAYGELAEAAYDGFNSDESSPEAGSCLYSPAELLAASGVSHPEYFTVTKYVYASCGFLPLVTTELGASGGLSAAVVPVPPVAAAFFVLPKPELRDGPMWRECNWMGFVAVATDEGAAALGRRDIVVAWRGTVQKLEFLSDGIFSLGCAKPVLQPIPGPLAAAYNNAKVHDGFLTVYLTGDEYSQHYRTCARDQVLEEVRRLMDVHKDEVTSITVTGHSLGAALATLNAVDMVAHGVNVPPASSKQPPCPMTAFLFACPRVGNDSFKSVFASFDLLRAIHVKNKNDIVPTLPPEDFEYVDVATATLPINTDRSKFLRPGNVLTYHNLECYLHGVAGDHGNKDFWLEVDRDIALVNKSADALKYEFGVPANWWADKKKLMVKGADGRWKRKDDLKEA
ncbi:hypothetical protein CFC21_027099 [Triticum aestivum]|uniref:Phospholipase A1 n=2 Tax=Triticum aestivum TaxID=4565 RepID=A0A3B6D4D7_WHEAT|nr:phospholipase A1-II 7-like [Triticum aestivum]KAF7012961.1 hypothetical protein CFC21_027099 [Triticum aestivum]